MLLLSVFGQNQRAEKRFGIKVLLRKNHSQTLVVSNLLKKSNSFSNGCATVSRAFNRLLRAIASSILRSSSILKFK